MSKAVKFAVYSTLAHDQVSAAELAELLHYRLGQLRITRNPRMKFVTMRGHTKVHNKICSPPLG